MIPDDRHWKSCYNIFIFLFVLLILLWLHNKSILSCCVFVNKSGVSTESSFASQILNVSNHKDFGLTNDR